MTLPYFLRLALLSLAVYFLVHLAAEITAALFAPFAIRKASRLAPARAAHRLLTLRLAPTAVALAAVVIFCIPSYLWLEPDRVEVVGLRCFALAALALTAWGISVGRAARALRQSQHYLRDALAAGRAATLLAGHAPVCLTDHPSPAVVLAGVFRSRVIVSGAAAAALTSEQLDLALQHERAHARSRDNLKRLVLLLAPGLLPRRTASALENAWARAAECAADDRATAGDPLRAVALADALVQVSRLTTQAPVAGLVTSLASGDLAQRVDRLLNPSPFPHAAPARASRLLLAVSLLALLLAQPLLLHAVHDLLEKLI